MKREKPSKTKGNQSRERGFPLWFQTGALLLHHKNTYLLITILDAAHVPDDVLTGAHGVLIRICDVTLFMWFELFVAVECAHTARVGSTVFVQDTVGRRGGAQSPRLMWRHFVGQNNFLETLRRVKLQLCILPVNKKKTRTGYQTNKSNTILLPQITTDQFIS